MKKVKNNKYEQLHNLIAEINSIVKDELLKHEILDQLNICLRNGTFFIDGNMFVAQNGLETNHCITLLIDNTPADIKAFSSIKYTYTSGECRCIHKTIEYINYYDDCYSLKENKEIQIHGKKSIVNQDKIFDKNGLEISRKTSFIEEIKENENYQFKEKTTIYHRIGNRITKEENIGSYEDILNDDLNQKSNYEEYKKYYSGVTLEEDSFENIFFVEIDEVTYGYYLRKVPAKVLKI